MKRLIPLCVSLILVSHVVAQDADKPKKKKKMEFTSLFDGESLEGWRGRPHFDPRKEAAFSDEERAKKQAEWDADMAKHWSVADGEIVSDGHGVFLTTKKDYGDFVLSLDWKMKQNNGDSGIYIRGCPQVQIWDPSNEREKKNGADKGSGALWNNGEGHDGKWPLVKADKPIGEWNTFRIKMIGSRVWVWFNGKPTVKGAYVDNYFDRKSPVFAKGPIQLQTHGSEMRFRNVKIREIKPGEANFALRKMAEGEYEPIFNGEDFTGWKGPTDKNEVKKKTIFAQHGTIYHDEEYEDFSVQFQFKLPPGGNNGLAIRYPGEGDTAYVGMCELQVLDNTAEKYAKLDPRQYHGSAYGKVAAHRGFLRPAGKWNFQRVTVKGSTIVVELNGTKILDCDVSKVTDFMGGKRHAGTDRTKGYFGFAGHGDPVQFRKVEARRL
ncbi:MAG: DUF1080 domain-containing protein [Planctomycetota bacterium]